MRRVKTDSSLSLTSLQLQRLMFLSVEGPPLDKSDAEAAVHRWWTVCQRQRQPGLNPWEFRQGLDRFIEMRPQCLYEGVPGLCGLLLVRMVPVLRFDSACFILMH